jgi:hypothetical protein
MNIVLCIMFSIGQRCGIVLMKNIVFDNCWPWPKPIENAWGLEPSKNKISTPGPTPAERIRKAQGETSTDKFRPETQSKDKSGNTN